ncbi:MAG: hypothetical protein RR575_01290 [Acinetobacter sp.]
MFRIKPLYLTLLTLSAFAIPLTHATSSTLMSLSDEQLSETTGQALMSLSYIAPTDTANLERQRAGGNTNIGFYKLGLEAELELNANIKKLQLGCGGSNGAGACDIDIDNLSLSGLADTDTGRASSSAKMTNPFIEFAIKNPNSASTREITGLRLSAEKVVGLLTAGTENSTTQNGINAISGFMRIQSDSSGYVYGKANTAARKFIASPNATYMVDGVSQTYNNQVTGKVKVTGLGFLGNAISPITFATTDGGFNVPAMSNIPFIRSGVVVNGNRVSSLPLQAVLNVPQIQVDWRGVYPENGQVNYANPVESPVDWNFQVPSGVQTQGGGVRAVITDCGFLACLVAGNGKVLPSVMMKGAIQGIKADVTINQGLGYIHYLPINSAFSLSLQSQALKWPGSYSGVNPERTNVDGTTNSSVPATISDVAQKGWWMSFSDPINLGSVDPVKSIDIAPLFPQIATQITNYLMNEDNAASLSVTQLGNVITGLGDVNVGIGTLNVPQTLQLTLNDLQLNGQNFASNCYGSMKFC